MTNGHKPGCPCAAPKREAEARELAFRKAYARSILAIADHTGTHIPADDRAALAGTAGIEAARCPCGCSAPNLPEPRTAPPASNAQNTVVYDRDLHDSLIEKQRREADRAIASARYGPGLIAPGKQRSETDGDIYADDPAHQQEALSRLGVRLAPPAPTGKTIYASIRERAQ